MYKKHFGLKMLPFENVPDPMFFLDEGDYARLLNRITKSLKAGQGLIVVTGPVGSGKTTLSQMIKSNFSDDIRLIWMAEPPGNSIELFLFISRELGLKPSPPIKSILKKALVIRNVRDALLKINSEGRKCLLIIDEINQIADDVLNGIRLLNNLEEGSIKLIQILLFAQEELMEKINMPEMEPFKQRIETLEITGEMNPEIIRKYISYRIKVAGGQPSIFSDIVWEAFGIAFDSGGTPRIINSLCDRSLTVAFEREKTMVDADDVYEAAKRMGLQKENIFYKYCLKQREIEKQDPSTREDNFIEEPELVSKALEFSKESDGTDMEKKNGLSETSHSPRNKSADGVSTSEISQKGLKKNRFRTFLRMILGKKNGKPADEKETAISIEEKVAGTTKKIDIIADKEGKKSRESEETAPSSEWVTIDSKGATTFKPVSVKDKKSTKKKETAAEHDEWVRMGTKKIDIIADKLDKKAHKIKPLKKQRAV